MISVAKSLFKLVIFWPYWIPYTIIKMCLKVLVFLIPGRLERFVTVKVNEALTYVSNFLPGLKYTKIKKITQADQIGPTREMSITNIAISKTKSSYQGRTPLSDILDCIHPSKEQYEKFQSSLKDKLVSKWTESSESKVFQGVEIAQYDKFLDFFQEATGLDDKVRAELETMKFIDRMDDKVKIFSYGGTSLSGKFGMYVALKRPQVRKVKLL